MNVTHTWQTSSQKEKKVPVVNEIFWFGLLGGNMQKPSFLGLKTGLDLFAGSAY